MPRPYCAMFFIAPEGGVTSPRRGVLQQSKIAPSSVGCADSFPQKGEAIATKKRLCSSEHRRFAQRYRTNHPGRVTPESASIF